MPRKILIADDNAINRVMLNNTLSREYDVLEATDGVEALELVNRNYKVLSAILTDIDMPRMDGYELLRRIRENVLLSQLPVIVVTGSEDEASRVKALMLGANDFILKPFNPEIVKHCVRNNIALRETASILNAIQKDKLTGLYNREAFFERVSAAIKDREPGHYLLSCFDIDNFKLINDQHGAAEGDRILREIGRVVGEDMELAGGIGGRVSGDNFAVLLPCAKRELGITRIVRENRMAFSDKQAVVFSIGRYVINDLSLPASAIYDRAYIAKQSVKGRYDKHMAYFDGAMLDRLVSDQQIIADMDVAIEGRQFEVWFQPQRNHSTGALVGAEALVRWRHPKKGLIPPGDFIPVFEQNGFIYELDKYVWEDVCRLLRRWTDEGRRPTPVSVNISRYDIFRADFVQTLAGLIRRYDVPAEMLRLEITESAFAKSTKQIVEIVKQLIDQGFTVEIDDFGSGYSSLNTLKSVPAQVLKLDMRFLEGDGDSGRGGNILESIVRMAKWLGMSVIAEGVEDGAQADYLASVGCSYIQGYLYARPMPVPEYEAYCRDAGKEERLVAMEAAPNLNNNSFWDPKSMDTLIFNSYVGAACIFEYCNRNIELLRVNNKFTAILGNGAMSAEDVLKLNWLTCLTPESLALVRDIIRHSAQTGEEYTGEYEFLNITPAQPRTFLRSTMRVIATTGERMLVYCTSENITDQREALRREREAAELVRTMIHDMPGGYARMRILPDGRLTHLYFNDTYCAMRGMTREQMLAVEGEDAMSAVHPDDLPRVRATVREALTTGETANLRYRLRCGDGSYKWFAVFGRQTREKGGELAVSAYYTDVSAQVREEETQRALMDNLPSGAGIYEFKDGRMSLVYQNKSYWELVGLNDAAFPDPSPMSALHRDDLPVIMRELTSALEQQRDVSCDIRLRHLTEGYRYVHLMGRIVAAGDGGYHIYATFTPISDEAMSVRQTLPIAIQAMMDASSEVAFVKGKDLRYLTCSRQFALLSGRESEKELIGKRSCDVFPPELAAQNNAIDAAILKDGQSYVDRDIPFPTADGVRNLLFSKYPLLDSAGNVIGIYGTGRDVTEARRQQSRLELLTNNIPGGIAVYEGTPDALDRIRLVYFSDGFCALFGYGREEYAQLAELNPLGLVAAGDVSRMREGIIALVRDGVPLDFVYRARAKDGAVKWINVKAIMGEPNGGNLTVNAVFFDATEQKLASDKLRISEEVNRLAIQQSKNVVCRYEVASRRLTVSPGVNPIFGLSPVEEDVPYSMVRAGKISPETTDAYTAFYESILRGEKQGRVLFQRQSARGWRWVEGLFTAIFSDGDEPVTAVISYADVTESMEKDAAWQKWRQSIQDRPPASYSLYHCNLSRDLVLDATEGLLIPDQQAAGITSLSDRTANYARLCVTDEDRDRFLAMMDRAAQLYRFTQGKRSDMLEYREKLPGGGTRWLRLTVNLVDLPASQDVEAYLMFENIDDAKRAELDILTRAETDSLAGLLNRKAFIEKFERMLHSGRWDALSALLIIDLDGFKQVNDRFGHAVGDETLIEMGQKLRATFGGEHLVGRLGGDEFVVCMCGVPHLSAVKEKAALICALLHKSFSLEVQLSASVGVALYPRHGESFEALYRKADAALYHVKETGKDNYAVYTEDMGEKPLPPEALPPEDEAAELTRYGAPKRRMLIVEDNEISRDYLVNLFSEDFLVDTAAEGTAALVRLRRYGSGVSVVLLDLMMPGLDGFAVLRQMRESLTTQNIPVIVVSGMNEREACLKAIREGASDYITKPVDAEILKLRVASVLSRAENELLRAKNRYLALQNEEAKRLAEARRHSEELSVALHAAERADLAKSQFLSSMSHEIRTPLNAIIGYNCLTKSEVASRHLLTLINDVLDMSAIESGKMKVDASPFDFRGLISSLTVMFFSQARAKGVDFEVQFDQPVEEWFVGDQLRINQVLTNLLSNAVKFTPDGGRVTLTITESILDDATTAFRFVVSDTGIGMTQEYLEHIWTPFEQAEASISRRFGGTGLGLSITKNLVSLMNGAITVESKPGVGSTFTVRLTLARTEQPKRPAHYDFTGVNALVVDDDASTCDYIKLLFDRCGARCMAFTSGARALEAFAAARDGGNPFNVCLVDWRMPQMNGSATIAEIRRLAGKDLPIVVVTAYDFAEVSDQAQRLGISRFISKPLFQSSLFDLLATISGEQTPLEEEKNEKYDFDGARVLLVEDNNMNMEVAKHILLSAGLAVDSAWNGQEAIDIFAASRPGTYRAILMDVHMPEVDGYEATRCIRASGHPDATGIPIIAMTADAFADDIAEAHSAGMNDHIAKPIDTDNLFRLLQSYMEDKNK